MFADMDAQYDLGDDHRFVGTLYPDLRLWLEQPDPDVVTAVTRSANLLREGVGPLLDLADRADGPRRRGRVERTGRHRHRPHGPGGQ
ncbi:hypothetical protein ACKI1J_11795 [Streptomyces scabiei]|uniref:hypothetical protein n=1 Tax=Streptomyces scabiei TaxID=1930 RepID=UPI0038F781CA